MQSATSNSATNGDWRDGFLFVGNQIIVDFVNTLPVIDGQPIELLPDAGALARWLVAAGLCFPSLVVGWKEVRSKSYMQDMKALQAFRELARSELLKLEQGLAVTPAFVECINKHLKQNPSVIQLSIQNGVISKGTLFEPKRPSDVFGPLAEDVAQLLTDRDLQRLRKCSGCAIHFLDKSKKGTRRWCSMAMCGNRSKVAAYAQRLSSQ